MKAAARVASVGCSLLLTGETGVGKGYLARWIHDHGCRAAGPFVPVNCGALPEGIVDSHLFGHVRGSFSDAHRDHLGLVRAAEGGTLFLDEVGELPHTAQLRLLRLAEEREVQPVGAVAPIEVDVRIIAATACDLEERVQQGAFRRDVFYRLDVIQFEIQPLRARPDEIPSLVEAFGREFAERTGRAPLELTPQAMQLLERHRWPGNVRELRSVIERLYVLCPGQRVTDRDVRTYGQLVDARPAARRFRYRDLRLVAALEAVTACGGNVSRAAEHLGVHRSTVHRWLATERLMSA